MTLPQPELRAQRRLYSAYEVATLSGSSPRQVGRWARLGILCARAPGRHRFTFRDLVTARALRDLQRVGVSTEHIHRALLRLRVICPEIREPLSALTLRGLGGRLVVRLGDVWLEPVSGQLVLPGVLDGLPQDLSVGRVIPLAALGGLPSPSGSQRPDDWFDAGVVAEAEGMDPEHIEGLYKKVLALDPSHLGALLQLGNLYHREGSLRRAAGCYLRATLSDSESAEAHYNLANTLDELGQWAGAVKRYEEALDCDPRMAQAHFNLALLYEKQSQRGPARRHWRRFIDLEPEGSAASVARTFLESAGPNPRLPLLPR